MPKRGSLVVYSEMRALEKIISGSTLSFGSFAELVEHLKIVNPNGKNPLVVIELTDMPKFVAMFVGGLEEIRNDVYWPVPASPIYNCDLPDGFASQHGECSYSVGSRYPADITAEAFKNRGIFVLNPDSDVGRYIAEFIEAGRTKAHEFWRQTHPDIKTRTKTFLHTVYKNMTKVARWVQLYQ